MKLASLKDGSRNGLLVLVSPDLKHAMPAPGYKFLQAALDDWEHAKPLLEEAARRLAAGRIAGTLAFKPEDCLSPLPRAYQWVDGSAYVNHVELVRRARGAEMPESFWSDPLMYQGGSDSFLAPTEPIYMASEEYGIDLEAEVAVITTDVPMGVTPEAALDYVALVLLVNDVSLRNLIPAELAKGFGFFQSKPSSAFSPVAVTPEGLFGHWRDGKLHLPLRTTINGQPLGRPDAGQDMTFHFGQLVAHAAKTRPLCAGTIVGSGTVSNKGADGGPGRPVAEGGAGYCCLAEVRTVETLLHGKPVTPFLRFGDTVRIEMLDGGGESVFGAIEQTVTPYAPPAATPTTRAATP